MSTHVQQLSRRGRVAILNGVCRAVRANWRRRLQMALLTPVVNRGDGGGGWLWWQDCSSTLWLLLSRMHRTARPLCFVFTLSAITLFYLCTLFLEIFLGFLLIVCLQPEAFVTYALFQVLLGFGQGHHSDCETLPFSSRNRVPRLNKERSYIYKTEEG